MSASTDGSPEREPWHLDKRVPIALILTLLGQTIGLGWWASGLSSTVAQHSLQIQELRNGELARMRQDTRTSEALARLDERMKAQTEILQRMDRALANNGDPRR